MINENIGIEIGQTYTFGNKIRTVTNIVNWNIYYKDNNGNCHKCDHFTFKNWIKTGKNKFDYKNMEENNG